MTPYERKSRLISRKVIQSQIDSEKNWRRLAELRETLAKIDAQLAQPDEQPKYSGEHKIDKDAFLNS